MLTKNILRNRATELSDDERNDLEAAISETRDHAAGHVLARQGVPTGVSTLLVRGLMTRHVDTVDGRRHLVALHVPGDFVDLHAFAFKQLDHDISALTDIRVALVPHAVLKRMQEEHRPVMNRLWLLTLLDAALHRQWHVRLSSLNALQRVAHFVCEMNARLLAIGQSDGRSFTLPMTQTDVGEVCGLTNVHVSRVLRQLREMGLCSWRASQVHVHDIRRLAFAGVFDSRYLHLNGCTAQRVDGQPGLCP